MTKKYLKKSKPLQRRKNYTRHNANPNAPHMRIIRHRAYCRAGLIGNPSDGYRGKTISFTMRNFFAQVVMYPWEHLEILWSKQDRNRFGSMDELVEDVDLNGYYGGVRLVKATIKSYVEFCRQQTDTRLTLHDQPFSVRYETNIPRGVGLAGSSAIVVATLKCLIDYFETPISPPLQASLARSVENDELGIACGFQDRVVQVYGGLVYMDFSEMDQKGVYACGQYEHVDVDRLPPLYIAYDLGASKLSSSVHGPLRTRFEDNDYLANTMAEIAALVPPARDAIIAGDMDSLHKLIDRNFDYRERLYSIHPEHMKMVKVARSVGASAKFAGSGGAIVGTYADQTMYDRLKQTLAAANPDWRVIKPEI